MGRSGAGGRLAAAARWRGMACGAAGDGSQAGLYAAGKMGVGGLRLVVLAIKGIPYHRRSHHIPNLLWCARAHDLRRIRTPSAPSNPYLLARSCPAPALPGPPCTGPAVPGGRRRCRQAERGPHGGGAGPADGGWRAGRQGHRVTVVRVPCGVLRGRMAIANTRGPGQAVAGRIGHRDAGHVGRVVCCSQPPGSCPLALRPGAHLKAPSLPAARPFPRPPDPHATLAPPAAPLRWRLFRCLSTTRPVATWASTCTATTRRRSRSCRSTCAPRRLPTAAGGPCRWGRCRGGGGAAFVAGQMCVLSRRTVAVPLHEGERSRPDRYRPWGCP